MNYLLVGGAGYIGSHVVRELARAGRNVTILDDLSKGHREAVRGLELVIGDLGEADLVSRVLEEKKIGCVMHFAAFSLVGESISVFGRDWETPDGTCIRDYVHVSDLAQAHILAAERLFDGSGSMTYNLGCQSGYSVLEIIEIARRVTGREIPAVEAERRPGDPERLVASSARIRSELGWKPVYEDPERMIRTAWSWHREHPHGFEKGK